MFKSTLHNIKEHVLQHNTYLTHGYSNVYMSDQGVHDGEQVVFPNDTLGDYFYMRLPSGANVTNNRAASISDCVSGLQARMNAILVAVVRNADADILLLNLASTLSQYGDISVTNVMWQAEEVIIQELRAIGVETMTAALARHDKNTTIVCIKFDYTAVVQQNGINCLPNPCECS